MADMQDLCSKGINILEGCMETSDLFLEPLQKQADHSKTFSKQLYGMSTKLYKTQIADSKALPKLLISGFDEEQVWQQLELRNIPYLKHLKKAMKELNSETLASNISAQIACKTVTKPESDSEDDEGYAFDDDDTGDDSDMPMEALEPEKSKVKLKSATQKKMNLESEVDDQFFKLSQMEEFLKREDLNAERTDRQSDEDSDDIDFYAEISSEDLDDEELSEKDDNNEKELLDKDDNNEKNLLDKDDDDDNEEDDLFSKNKKSCRDFMYEDFFDPPNAADEDLEPDVDEDDEHDVENEMSENKKDYDTRDYDPTEDMEMEDADPKTKNLFEEGSESENESPTKAVHKTTFQKQLEKDQKRIKQMEENLLRPKPWQLTGEVAASNRPENSLMRQPTTFDVNPKQNIIETTADLTSKVEEIIKMAITNKAWADVERKIKPKEDITTYKRRPELDQSKSKKSLAEIYEDDYLKLKHKPEEVEDPRHAEIQKLMDQLTPELYALFSHIPKPPVPEIKVVNNLPAITVEEVAPVGLSDAALLAPEEVKKKPKGDLKSETEKSTTDKKRERRKKKLRQKLYHKKSEEKMIQLAASNPALAKKHEKLQAMKKLKQHKNTVIVNKDNFKKVKSSKEFFSRLEETVHGKKQTK